VKARDAVNRAGGLDILVECLVGIGTFGALVGLVTGAESVMVGKGTVGVGLGIVEVESILEGGIV